jgi:hypothetical protein
MPSSGSFRRFAEWQTGDATDRVLDVGTIAATNRLDPITLGLCRVGYFGAASLSAVSAMVKIADSGSELGPIDVPFTLVVEEPIRVTLTPATPPAALLRLVLSVTPLCSPIAYSATHTIAAAIGAVLALPQWVREVTALPPASYVYRDRAGLPISGPLTGTFARPPAAIDVLVGAAGAIVLSY